MASTQATIDLVVRGSNAVNKLIQDVGQLQSAVDRINSRTLDVAPAALGRRASALEAAMQGSAARANDLGRDRNQILSQQRQAIDRLTQAQLSQQRALERAAAAERELSRLGSRDELASRRTDQLRNALRESASEAERFGDQMTEASASAGQLQSRLNAIRQATRNAISAASGLIDVNQTRSAANTVNALAAEYNRYGDSLRRSGRESNLVDRTLPRQVNAFTNLRNQIEQAGASLADLRSELGRLGGVEAALDIPPPRAVGQREIISPSAMAGPTQQEAEAQRIQQENELRQRRNARRAEISTQISAGEAGLTALETRASELGRTIARNQDLASRMTANRDPANRAGLSVSLNQIQAQAESLALVANNSAIASTAFNRFTVSAEMASIKLARAQQNTFTALAAGFSGGGGVNIPQGLRQEASIAGARNMVGQLISDIPNLTRSEGALNAHIRLLSQIRTILPFLSLEYRAVEEAIAGLGQELEGVGLRGQTSKIDPGAGQRLLKQREREDKIAQNTATAIDKVYQEQLGLADRIASSKLSVTEKEDLSLRLNRALDALGESQLENAAAMTRQIADQLKLKERLLKTKQPEVFGTLGTSFMPISGEMPKGRAQLQVQETQKAAKEIAAQQVVINKLQNQYALEEAKGVKFSEEKVQLNKLLDMLGQGQVTVSKANSAILGENIKKLRSVLGLRVLEAKVAGTYQGGGGKKATTAEQLEDRRTRLLERALNVQGTAIGLEARGAQISQERQEIEAAILRLKQLQGQASEDELKILLKQIQNLKIASKEISNALPPTQKSRTTDKTPFLEKLTGSPRISAAISEGLIGGAFPLLFGQGAGAAVLGATGGAVGGFAGGGLGFGLSLIGTALGTAFDTLAQAAQDTGKSLNYPIEGFENLKTAGLFASRQQEYYISKLIETGQTARAAAEIQARIVGVIGVQGANDLMDLGDSASVLSKKWAELNLQMQALVAGPVGDFLNLLAKVAGAKIESNAMAGLGERISRLTPEQRKAFQQEAKAFSGPDYVKGAEAILNRIAPQQLKKAKDDPAQQVADLDKAIEKADKARSLVQQGVALERSGVDLRLSVEDTVYGLRKRAADMEREAIEFRRSVEDQIFGKRQELEQKLIENERKRQQNAIDAFDLQLQKASTGLDPIAQGVVDAARDYLRIRAEGEADLQQAEKQLKLELQQIDQEVNRYKLQVEDRVSQMAIQRDEFSRDVSRARLQIERQIADRVVQVEEYRLAMAKHRYEMEIDLEKKKQIVAQQGLAVQATGGYTGDKVDGFPITSRPGMRRHPITGEMREHKGVDVAAPIGTALGYEIGGEILSAGWIRGYGNTLKVKLENGMTVLSAHLNEIFVTAGQKFQANQRLATVGSTGNSTGPHTHQESWMNGKADPYASLPFLQLGKAVSGKPGAGSDPDIHLQPGVGYFSRKTGRMVSGPGGAPASAAPAARVASGAMSTVGAAPVAPTAPAMPALPAAPQLVGVNDLMQQYLDIVEKIKAATKGATAADRERLAIQLQSARAAFEQQALAPLRQFQEQNRELEFEIQKRKERNRLLMEGDRPEIVEGKLRVMEIERTLNSVLEAQEVIANESVKVELERLGLNNKMVDSTFRLTEATLADLIATTDDVKKKEELRAKLQAILDLRDRLAGKAEGEARSAIGGAASIAKSEAEPGQKVQNFIASTTEQLNDLEQVAINVSQGIGNAVGNSLSGAVAGLIEGTTTAKEVFGGFLKDIGQLLVQEGTKMIAMYVAIAIAKAIAGMSGGGGGGGGGFSANAAGFGGSFDAGIPALPGIPDYSGAFAKGGMFGASATPFANGGAFTNSIVSSPTLFKFADGGVTKMGEMGEAGPEAIMPLSRGAGGRLGVDASGLREAMDRQQGGSSGSPVLSMSFQSTSINGVEYVSRDQLESAMAETRRNATRDGAKRGMTMTLDRIQNSSSTRRKVGI